MEGGLGKEGEGDGWRDLEGEEGWRETEGRRQRGWREWGRRMRGCREDGWRRTEGWGWHVT